MGAVPMASARVYAGRYEVLGTSTHCEIVLLSHPSTGSGLRRLYVWALYSGGAFVKSFATKREALQHCQSHPEL